VETINPKTFLPLIILNDLRHSAIEALKHRHKLPALILFYSFIDICAAMSCTDSELKGGKGFRDYLRQYALYGWHSITPFDLWSARSSLLHTFSPFGNHTGKPDGAKPIFYFSWPEKAEEVEVSLRSGGYDDFVLISVDDIKHIAISAFNAMWSRVEKDADFEQAFRDNAKHILKDYMHMRLEDELVSVERLSVDAALSIKPIR